MTVAGASVRRVLGCALGLLCTLAVTAACRTQTIPSTSLPEPVLLEASGEYVHAPSGVVFPRAAAGFVRSALRQYDREGNDVGASYQRIWFGRKGACAVIATVIAYPAWSEPFDAQYEEEAASAREGKSELSEVRRMDSPARHAGADVTVRAAEFLYRGDANWGFLPMGDLLCAFRHEPWHITYRVTFSALTRDDCVAATDQLLDALGLPRTGLPVGKRAPAR